MASVRKYGKGFRVEIRRKGYYKSNTFETKREAVKWANEQEVLLHS